MTAWRKRWVVAYAVVAAAFLASLARYYHPPFGFTALIDFPGATHTDEIPLVQSTPHYHNPEPRGGYDAQFYAQFAVEPLLRDPAIDRAMDNAPYRAHRILFSWTAYALGFGRPRWSLEVFALQNVAAWMVLAVVLLRWIPPVDARRFALWTACVWSHGLMSSVRLALVDGPSVMLLALAVAAAEARRPWRTAIVLGLAGLARETNLLGMGVFGAFLRRERRSWAVVTGCVAVSLLPLALWLDYLRSIYRSLAFAGTDHLVIPFTGLWTKIVTTADGLAAGGGLVTWLSVTALVALAVQTACVAVAFVRSERHQWAWAAAPFILLMISSHAVVWDGQPGAFTRVFLPITVGGIVLLARQARPSWWLILGCLFGAFPGVVLMLTG